MSLASIARESVGLDPEGRGVSEDAILDNPAAYAEYVRRRTWNRASARAAAAPPGTTIRVRVDRDPVRARRQYLRMPKEALVARLVSVEAAYAALEEQRLRESDLKLADWEQRRRTDRTD